MPSGSLGEALSNLLAQCERMLASRQEPGESPVDGEGRQAQVETVTPALDVAAVDGGVPALDQAPVEVGVARRDREPSAAEAPAPDGEPSAAEVPAPDGEASAAEAPAPGRAPAARDAARPGCGEALPPAHPPAAGPLPAGRTYPRPGLPEVRRKRRRRAASGVSLHRQRRPKRQLLSVVAAGESERVEQAEEGPACAALYAYLERATPAERREVFLALIEQDSAGGARLPALPGGTAASLGLIDVSPDAMLALYHERIADEPPWWDRHASRVRLARADLRGADLHKAALQEADLSGANLQDTDLLGANLQHADLCGADLRDAAAVLANLHWASLSGADLRGIHLTGADLRGAHCFKVDLRDAQLSGAVLAGADLGGADLRGAHLARTNLQGANLAGASLQGVDLTSSDLTHARLHGVSLERTRMHPAQFAAWLGEEVAAREEWPSATAASERFANAAGAYTLLQRNFESLGDHEGASWAYCKSRRMAKHAAWHRFTEAMALSRLDARSLLSASVDELAELVCDYGESIWRVLATMAAVFACFTYVYWLSWGVVTEPELAHTSRVVDDIRFSLGAMTTMRPSGLLPSRNAIELLTYLQALLGIGLTGLLGFIAGKRIRRS